MIDWAIQPRSAGRFHTLETVLSSPKLVTLMDGQVWLVCLVCFCGI